MERGEDGMLQSVAKEPSGARTLGGKCGRYVRC